MPEHRCINAEIIRKLEVELAVAQSDITKVKSDITDIKNSIAKFNWWFISILISSVGGMAMIILKMN